MFHSKKYRLFFILVSLLTGCSDQKSPFKLEVIKEGKQLLVNMSGLTKLDSVEIRFYNDRNTKISNRSDRSEFNPKGPLIADQSEVWYPVVDLVLENESKAVAVFNEDITGDYTINGMFFKEVKALKKTVNIDDKKLLYWENSLTMEPKGTLKEFYLSYSFSVQENSFEHNFKLLSEDGTGKIEVLGVSDKEAKILSSYQITERNKVATDSPLLPFKNTRISKERLIASLQETVKLTLRMQDANPDSPTYGGLNLFYDYDAKTYRRTHWIWSSGPSIKLLLDTANNVPEITQNIAKEHLKEVADQIGSTSQKFQVKDPENPVHGIVTSRWKEMGKDLKQHAGFEEYYSIEDGLFMVAWGWMPLYRETGNAKYLEDAKIMVQSAQKLLDTFEIIPMDYIVSEKKWKDFTISEAGFGSEGICEVYLETKDETIKATGELFTDRLLTKFQQEDGLWACKVNFSPEKIIPSQKHTRGQGWAMEGLISSYNMIKNSKYKKLAERMATVLMDYQHNEGYWTYNFDKPVSEVGISEKGTALWSLLFYRLYEITKNPKHLEAARKALIWCMDNQYTGADVEGQGGVIGVTFQSGVTYRNWFPLACSYTSGFFGLAILEELKLQNNKDDI